MTLVHEGFAITVLSVERTEQFSPREGTFADMVKRTMGDPVKPKQGFELAVVRVGFKALEKQGKTAVFPRLQLVDAKGKKHDCAFSNLNVRDDWDGKTEEIIFTVPKDAPELVKLTFGKLTFDIDGVGPPAR